VSGWTTSDTIATIALMVAADHDRQMITHQIEGDRNAAVERAHELNVKYLVGDPDEPEYLLKRSPR